MKFYSIEYFRIIQRFEKEMKPIQVWSSEEVRQWLRKIAIDEFSLDSQNPLITQIASLARHGKIFSAYSLERLIQNGQSSGISVELCENIYLALQNLLSSQIYAQPVIEASPLYNFLEAIPHISPTTQTYSCNQESYQIESLKLPPGIFWFGVQSYGSNIMIRQAYRDLLNIILKKQTEGSRGHIITGTPGTGKSIFLMYLFYSLHINYERIVVELSNAKIVLYFERQNDGTYFCQTGTFESFRTVLDYPETLYLFDGSQRSLPVLNAYTLATFSPRRDNYKEFKKYSPCVLYMPLWSCVELDMARITCFSHISLRTLIDLYTCWGGVIRWTLAVPTIAKSKNALIELDETFGVIKIDTLIQTMATLSSIDKGDNFVHRILHIGVISDPEVPYERVYIKFASSYVMNRLIEKANRESLAYTSRFIRETSDEANFASLRGQLFEHLAHRRLSQGGRFNVINLENHIQSAIEIPSGRIIDLYQLEDLNSSLTSYYLKPLSKNFPVADALIPPNIIFQMTVSAHHPIKAAKAEQLVSYLEDLSLSLPTPANLNDVILCFVVPTDSIQFNQQSFINVDGTLRNRLSPQLDKIRQYVLYLDV